MSHPPPEHFRKFARYNLWANARLYAAIDSLSDAERRKPRAAFFGSIFATLNHILLADRIWFGRFENKDSGIRALDEMLYDDFASLWSAREEMDEKIVAWTDALTPKRLDRILSYKSIAGQAFETPLPDALTHFFNHQTHHRGQAHDQLSQTQLSPPPLDFIYFLRETG